MGVKCGRAARALRVKGFSQLCGTKHRGAQLARGDGVRVRGKALDLLCHHRLGHDRLLHGAGKIAGGRGGGVLGTKPCPATKIARGDGWGRGDDRRYGSTDLLHADSPPMDMPDVQRLRIAGVEPSYRRRFFLIPHSCELADGDEIGLRSFCFFHDVPVFGLH